MRQVLIVSTDDILLYQPSILNLYDFLEKDFNVKIISFEPQYLGKKKELSRNVIYVSYSYMAKIYRFVDLIINAVLKRANKFFAKIKFRSQLIRAHKYRLLIKELKKHTSQHVIAVDLMSLCATQQVFVSAHFLSLELLQDDPYYKKINFNKILSVIIQNSDRYNYLFPKIFLKTFYIQNAPFHDNKCINNNPRNGLIWGGTVVKEFGVLFCLDFVRAYPEYKLELKGAVEKKTAQLISKKYGDLIESKKIAFNNTYLSIREFIHYLSNFEIGFCFYDWNLIRKNINYQTAPSGKLFMYLAAGVPVVACNIKGFKFVEDYNAGILIDDYQPHTIYNAVKKIESNYSFYQKNCYRAFDDMNFDVGANKFKNYLLSLC